ncbi:3-ketoacyl-CoA thiolase, mitochondrial [Eumeta japonica]|uniref:3-ketoacyl-CoA thiolase, mitochondrial n=1 Tax=Eumeta variegata TaxID=151549 RepID=A0A4C1XK54_EUMVA|nr:3-ketoacyl-CoA thiolase, mitochondrial [Eumeta japonica]
MSTAVKGVFIVGAKRTPFGTFGGVFKNTSATDLQTVAAVAALKEAGVNPEKVDTINVGQVMSKSAAEAHRIPAETCCDNALLDTTCKDWFRHFENNDFKLEVKECSGTPKNFEDEELEELLD